jgi:hypothetical protein
MNTLEKIQELAAVEKATIKAAIDAIGQHIRVHLELGCLIAELRREGEDVDLDGLEHTSLKLFRLRDRQPDLFSNVNNVLKVYRLVGIAPPTQKKLENVQPEKECL